MKPWFVFSFFLVILTTSKAQNLVPDPGFEQNDRDYTSYKGINGSAYWMIPHIGDDDIFFNFLSGTASTYNMIYPFASIVHNKPMYEDICDYCMSPYIDAFQGSKALWLYTWLNLEPTYRSYASVKLSEPLEKGKAYCIYFQMTNGKNYIKRWASNGLGLYLSNKELVQSKEITTINAKPQIELNEVFFDTEWRQVAFKFVADSNYQFLHLGCFRNTDELKLKEIEQDTAYHWYAVYPPMNYNGAFYFIDDMHVEPFVADKHQEKINQFSSWYKLINAQKEAVVSKEGDTLVMEKQGIVPVFLKKLTINVRDYSEQDGDIISIYYNGQLILDHYTLENKPKKLTINIADDGSPSYLIMKAHNLGTIPPNTSILEFYDGKNNQSIKISSTLQHSGTVEFYMSK